LVCIGAVSADTANWRIQEHRLIERAAQQSWGTAVYEAIGENRFNPDLLPVLESIVPNMKRGHTLTEAEVEPLVDVLSRGAQPSQLLRQIGPFMGPQSDTRVIADSGWKAGGYLKWGDLCDFMYAQARTAKDATQSRRYARAALLLAAQDSFAAGGGRLQIIAFSFDFERLTGLKPEVVRKIRLIVAVAGQRELRGRLSLKPWQNGDPTAPPPKPLVEGARWQASLIWILGNYVASLPPEDPRASSGLNALENECGETGRVFAQVLRSRERWDVVRMPFVDGATLRRVP
jgi:hypothetical protein